VTAGTLFLLPAWIAEDAPLAEVIPAGVLERIRGLRDFVVEDAKSARRFLAACGHPVPMREIAMAELSEHTAEKDVSALLDPARAGRDLGLLSEAGAPAVADPGSRLVAAAHAEGIRVVPCSGPSSIVLALMASGLEGQRFRFAGYLPAGSRTRAAAIAQLEHRSAADQETQVFIETPYRNDALLCDLLKHCKPSTRLAVCADLSGAGEWIRMASISDWNAKAPEIGKRPAIFLLLAARERAR
jgi:16S rRNA (cytidine1402-2'-O)-methyltransferase